MKKSDLQRVLSALGLRVMSENTRSSYLNCGCPFAAFGLHKHAVDREGHFGARWSDDGISTFKCFACKQQGSIAKLVKRLAHLRQADYSALLADVMAIDVGILSTSSYEPFDKPDEVAVQLTPLNEALYDGLYPSAWSVDEARDYLISRNISSETAESLGLLFRDSYQIERPDGSVGTWYRGDILFPVRDRAGALYGWSGRTVRDAKGIKPKVFDRDLPKRSLILGEHRWRPGFPKVIIEGLFGLAHLIEIGVEQFADIGAIMGSVLTPEKAAILADWGDMVVALTDNDSAGDVCLFGPVDENGVRNETLAMVPILSKTQVVSVPFWPYRADETVKTDPDELTLEEVRSMVFDTIPYAPPPPPKPARKFPVDKHFNRGYKRV